MAFTATHIKFALDFKDKYDIKDLSHYLSGAIYPDSRYVTGIDRNLTHNSDLHRSSWVACCSLVSAPVLVFLP